MFYLLCHFWYCISLKFVICVNNQHVVQKGNANNFPAIILGIDTGVIKSDKKFIIIWYFSKDFEEHLTCTSVLKNYCNSLEKAMVKYKEWQLLIKYFFKTKKLYYTSQLIILRIGSEEGNWVWNTLIGFISGVSLVSGVPVGSHSEGTLKVWPAVRLPCHY